MGRGWGLLGGVRSGTRGGGSLCPARGGRGLVYWFGGVDLVGFLHEAG